MTPKDKGRKSGVTYTKIIFASVAAMALGYYMLNYIATWEKPLLGVTFHIVFGCALMAVSAITLGFAIKRKYFPKKKANRSRPIFLDDTLRKPKTTRETEK